MLRRVLDSNILIGWWLDRKLGRMSAGEVRREARRLIDAYGTNAILTPVYIEVLAGATSNEQLRLHRVFLKQFDVVDQWEVLPPDWRVARDIAGRLSPDGRKRNLGDCLIKAIAQRLECEVISLDGAFDEAREPA